MPQATKTQIRTQPSEMGMSPLILLSCRDRLRTFYSPEAPSIIRQNFHATGETKHNTSIVRTQPSEMGASSLILHSCRDSTCERNFVYNWFLIAVTAAAVATAVVTPIVNEILFKNYFLLP